MSDPSARSGQDLPTGTVTFLFTDIEGSTTLAQQYPAALPDLLARHHVLLHEAIEAHHGYVFQIIGDAFCAAFYTASDALNAALDAQRDLQHEAWDPAPIKVRMGIHTGSAQAGTMDTVSGGYTGYASLARTQRVMSVAYGDQILLSNASTELVRGELPPGIALRDMGEHRLKGLLNPERLWQPLTPQLRAEFPPLKSLNAIPNNLPVQLTSFIGREAQIAEVKRLLDTTRLLTLTGSGGAGKTRLSLQVAAEVIDAFAQGVWFVELAPLTDPALIPQTVASVLGLREEPGRSLMTALTDYLRGKTALIILDNCEHVIEGCAQLADTLLRTAPNVKVLATSREALNIAGEATYRVPSLASPNPQQLPSIEVLTQYDAVRLFIERAVAVIPSFEVNNANAPAVAQICHHLDGIPLAIELAAARVRGLKVEQIAQRLDDRFRLLTGGSRTALPRHQTLRATIDWSHSLLTEQERVLFRRLSVFAGGWSIEAAEAVCAGDGLDSSEILDLLLRLVDKSLISMAEHSAETRYHLLETIREYARERLQESNDADNVRNRHLVFFLQLAEADEPTVHAIGAIERKQWSERLELELDNLRAALEWSLGNDVEAGLRLAGTFGKFCLSTLHQIEGLIWLRTFLALPETSLHTLARAKALLWTATLEDESIQESRSRLEESLTIYQESNEQAGVVDAYFWLGQLAKYQSDWASAGTLFSESLRLSEALGDKHRAALALSFLGQNFLVQGDTVQARRLCEESVRIYQELGMKFGPAIPLGILGNLALGEEGDLARARFYYEESLALYRQADMEQNAGWMLIGLGKVAARQGHYQEARTFIERSMAIHREYGIDLGRDFRSLAFLTRAQGNYEQASELYKKCLPLLKDDQYAIAEGMEGLAGVSVMQGKAECAIMLFGAAAALREAINTPAPPLYRADNERDMAMARAQLSEETFNAAWKAGRAMTLDQAVDYALNRDDAAK